MFACCQSNGTGWILCCCRLVNIIQKLQDVASLQLEGTALYNRTIIIIIIIIVYNCFYCYHYHLHKDGNISLASITVNNGVKPHFFFRENI